MLRKRIWRRCWTGGRFAAGALASRMHRFSAEKHSAMTRNAPCRWPWPDAAGGTAPIGGDQPVANGRIPMPIKSSRSRNRMMRCPTQAADHHVVVDPDDPDGQERSHVRDVHLPLADQTARQALSGLQLRQVDVQHQQRDRHRDDSVGERLEPGRVHAADFAGRSPGPVAGCTGPLGCCLDPTHRASPQR